MRSMTRVLWMMLMVALAAPTTLADDQTDGGDAAGKAALKDAVAALQDRYIKARTEGRQGPGEAKWLRTEGKKFAKDLTPELIVLALNERIHNEPSVDAYVKWELVAHLKEIPDELAEAATRAYFNAPAPEPMPGIDQRDRMQFKQALQGTRRGQLDQIRKQWDQELLLRTGGNRAIFGYRDALRQRLPVNPDTIRAALQDAYQRVQAGHNAKSITDKVIANAKSWAIDAPSSDVRAVAELMFSAAGQKGPTILEAVEWNDGAKAIRFAERSYTLDKELKLVAEEIVAMNQGGGLQLK